MVYLQGSDEDLAFSVFKDCLARRLLARLSAVDSEADESDLDEFTTYLASEVWPSFPLSIRRLALDLRAKTQHTIDAENLSLDATPSSFSDTLMSYGISPDSDDACSLLLKALSDYAKDIQVSLEVPIWTSTRTPECEICERDVPLTYHHLIPRSVHAKVLKRGWHPEERLGSVAWLCR